MRTALVSSTLAASSSNAPAFSYPLANTISWQPEPKSPLAADAHRKCASLSKTHRANSGRELVDCSRLVWIPAEPVVEVMGRVHPARSNTVAKQRHRIFAASELRYDHCSDKTFAHEPLNRVRRGLVDPLLRSPNCIEWRLAIDRESKLSVRLYKRSRFLDRPPHLASVVQNSPSVDDVKRSGLLRGSLENRNNSCIPVFRWRAAESNWRVVATEFSSISTARTRSAPSERAASECNPEPDPISRKLLPLTPSGKSFSSPAIASAIRRSSIVLAYSRQFSPNSKCCERSVRLMVRPHPMAHASSKRKNVPGANYQSLEAACQGSRCG